MVKGIETNLAVNKDMGFGNVEKKMSVNFLLKVGTFCVLTYNVRLKRCMVQQFRDLCPYPEESGFKSCGWLSIRVIAGHLTPREAGWPCSQICIHTRLRAKSPAKRTQ